MKQPKELIAELRSGKWLKGKGRLHDPGADAYCCLGVWCRVSGLDDEDFVDEDGDLRELPQFTDPDAQDTYDKAGLSNWPIVDPNDWVGDPDTDTEHLLATLNDSTESWEEKVIPYLEAVQAAIDDGAVLNA